MTEPLVGIVMGSDSDWEVMQHAARRLTEFGVAHEARVVSAHRTPDQLYRYAEDARRRGLRCIIAGAGGAAHLPGMLAAKTTLPVLGVPIPTRHLQGLDSLLSIVQMPAGIPVATFAIGTAGAGNAALYAVSILALSDSMLGERLEEFRRAQERRVMDLQLPETSWSFPAPGWASSEVGSWAGCSRCRRARWGTG
jgi:5-(carboxyamino)imidazole ribonucleotide mutase